MDYVIQPKIRIERRREFFLSEWVDRYILFTGTLFLSFPLFLYNSFTVLLLCSASMFFMTILRPKIGIILFFAITFIIPFSNDFFNYDQSKAAIGGITYDGILNLIFLIGLILAVIIRKTPSQIYNSITSTPGLKYFLLFIIVSFFEIPFHWKPLISLKELIKYAATFLFLYGLSIFFTKRDLALLKYVIIATIVFLLYYLLHTFLYGVTEQKTIGEFAMTRYNPKALSAVDLSVLMIMFFPLTCYYFIMNSGFVSKVLWFIAGLIILLNPLFLVARAPIFALVLSSLIFLRSRKFQYTLLFIVILVLIFYWDSVLKLIVGSFNWSDPYNTMTQRTMTIWLPILNSDYNNFLAGVGNRGFGDYLYKISGYYFTAAHNMFLVIFVELGIFAFIFWIFGNIQIIRSFFKSKKIFDLISLQPFLIFLIASLTSTVNFNFFYRTVFVLMAIASLKHVDLVTQEEIR